MQYFSKLPMCLLATFCLLLPTWAFAQSVATVIGLKGGVQVERAGQVRSLALKDNIEVKDTIRTDANGKVQLFFQDNSTVTVGVNSVFSIDDYDNADIKSFKGNLAVGFARFVTGAIVENSPEAFSVKTPEATVGIRGTTFAVLTQNQLTTVSTENTLKEQSVVVSGTTIAPGYTAVFGPNGVLVREPRLMTPQERGAIVLDARIRTPLGSVELADTYIPSQNKTDFDDLNGSVNQGGPSLNEALLGSGEATASGSISLTDTAGNTGNGSFSFEVDLDSGAIDDGEISSSGGFTYDGDDGEGIANSQGFTLSGDGQTPSGGNSDWTMSGSPLGVNKPVNGNISIDSPAAGNIATGTASGTLTLDDDD